MQEISRCKSTGLYVCVLQVWRRFGRTTKTPCFQALGEDFCEPGKVCNFAPMHCCYLPLICSFVFFKKKQGRMCKS
ncbi:hypothetical protein PAHAL_9G018600 [Panicum hallii]|uniref:Uncharacterized protein n=1 Tax=Panicum hallii TaxID=206008 RepID=A0A2T8HZV6_9POAL|nr:hypothetical protein PAHAL_9G018600 [Panicum hallii]